MKYSLLLIALATAACTPPCPDSRCSGGYGPLPSDPPPSSGGVSSAGGGGAQQPPPATGGQAQVPANQLQPAPPPTGAPPVQPPPPVQQPPVQQPPIPQTGARDCADQGKSCETDTVVADWLGKCRGSNNAPGPCHCAAAATWACFNAHHCFQEAGAATTLTQAQIRQSFDVEINGATAAQTQCNLLHP